MKERIVIKDEFWVKHFQEREKDFYEEDLCSGGNPEEWWHYEKEQVPETWTELLELYAKYEELDTVDFILIKGVWFNKDGEVSIGEETIAENRTPEQMWQIIKGLIGDM